MFWEATDAENCRVGTEISIISEELRISESDVSGTSCHKFNRRNFFKVRQRWEEEEISKSFPSLFNFTGHRIRFYGLLMSKTPAETQVVFVDVKEFVGFITVPLPFFPSSCQ